MRRTTQTLALMASAALLLSSCGGESDEPSTSGTQTGTQQGGQDGGGQNSGGSTAEKPTGATATVTIDGTEYVYASDNSRACRYLAGMLFLEMDMASVDGEPSDGGRLEVQLYESGQPEPELGPAYIKATGEGNSWIAADPAYEGGYDGLVPDGDTPPPIALALDGYQVSGTQEVAPKGPDGRLTETVEAQVEAHCTT